MLHLSKEILIEKINCRAAEFFQGNESNQLFNAVCKVSEMMQTLKKIDINEEDSKLEEQFYYLYTVFSLSCRFYADILNWMNAWNYLVACPNFPDAFHTDRITYFDLSKEASLLLETYPYCEKAVNKLQRLREWDFDKYCNIKRKYAGRELFEKLANRLEVYPSEKKSTDLKIAESEA